MARASRKLADSGIYHVITRGAGHCILFEDDHDRRHFLNVMDEVAARFNVKVYAWCLMDNHVHLLVESGMPELAGTMRELESAYATYFNRRHERIGPLFQGRFRSEPVETDEYFLAALRYIHRNPVKAGLSRMDAYRWSSYREYVGIPSKVPYHADTRKALSILGGIEEFRLLHAQDDKAVPCIDVNRERKAIGDGEALEVARSVLREPLEQIRGMERNDRDSALRTLKAANLSVRQIERLTGVSKSIVARA